MGCELRIVYLSLPFFIDQFIAAKEHRVVKRQSGPLCGGAISGSVNMDASAGTPITQVISSDSSGLIAWYTITDPTSSQAFNINPYTGTIYVGSNFAALATITNTVVFAVQTTDEDGGTCLTPITIFISGGGNSGSSVGQTSATQFANICGCAPGYYCYQQVCYSLFPSSTNSFTVTNCAAGAFVGTVFISNAYNFAVDASSGNFYITSAGNLFIINALSSGTYSVGVIAYNYAGSPALYIVTVTASCYGAYSTFCIGTFCFYTGFQTAITTCDNGGFAILGICFNQTTSTTNSVGATFSSTSYDFTTSDCISGTYVGSIGTSGASSYSMNYGFQSFSISSTGVISLAATLSAGQYSASVVATTSSGFQTSIPVTINVLCASR